MAKESESTTPQSGVAPHDTVAQANFVGGKARCAAIEKSAAEHGASKELARYMIVRGLPSEHAEAAFVHYKAHGHWIEPQVKFGEPKERVA